MGLERGPGPQHDVSPQDLIAAYREEGRADFSELPREDLRHLFDYYAGNQTAFRDGEKTEILEQFLQTGAGEESEFIKIASGFSPDQQETIAHFLGEVTETGRYPRLFHALWDSLPYEDQRKFTEKFTTENPEGAIMVAPFLDFRDYVVRESKDPQTGEPNVRIHWEPRFHSEAKRRFFGEQERKNLFDLQFNRFDKAKELIDLCLACPNGPGLESAVKHFLDKEPLLVYPYFSELLRREVVSEEEVRGALVGEEGKRIDLRPLRFSARFFETEEEQGREDALAKRVSQLRGKKQDPEIPDNWPERFLREDRQIKDEAKKRAMDYAFRDFSSINGLFSGEQKREIVFRHLDSSVPILYAVRNLHLEALEVRGILGGLKASGIEPFYLLDLGDVRAVAELGIEDDVVETLVEKISQENQGGWWGRSSETAIILNQLEMMPGWMSPNGVKSVVEAIDRYAPLGWLHRLDYIDRYRPGAFLSLVEQAKQEGEPLLVHYHRIFAHIGKLEREGRASALEKRALKDSARSVFERFPEAAFIRRALFSEVYSREEQKTFLRSHLAEDGHGLMLEGALQALVLQKGKTGDRRGTDQLGAILEELRDSVRAKPAVVMGLFSERHTSWKAMGYLFPQKERLDFLLANLGDVDAGEFFDRIGYELFSDLAERPVSLDKVARLLLKTNEFAALATFLSETNRVLSRSQEARRNRRYRHTPVVEGEELSAEKERALKSFWTTYTAQIVRVCRERPTLLFESKEMLRIESPDLRAILQERAFDYLTANPRALGSMGMYLSTEVYNKVVAANLSTFAFLREDRGYPLYDPKKLSPDILLEIRRLSPIARVEAQEKLTEDYYQTILRDLEGNPFLLLYRQRLERLAKLEHEQLGNQLRPLDVYPNLEFLSLVNRLGILANNSLVLSARTSILALSPQKREEIVPILEAISVRQLDKGSGRVWQALEMLETNYPEAQRILRGVLGEGLLEKFELREDWSPGALGDFSAEAMRVLELYFDQTRKNRHMREALNRFIRLSLTEDFGSWRTWGAAVGEKDQPRRLEALQRLKENKLLPRELTLDQYEAWINVQERAFEETLDVGEGDIRRGVREIMAQAVENHHLDRDVLPDDYETAKNAIDALLLPMLEWSSRLEILRKKIKETKEELSPEEQREYRDLQQRISRYRAGKVEEFAKAEADLVLARLEESTMAEIEHGGFFVGGQEVPFQKAFSLLEKGYSDRYPGFTPDVQRLRAYFFDSRSRIFGGQRVSRTALRLDDRLDLETYLKIGADPVTTCQHYQSAGSYNYGLLSYVIDPNIRILQMRNEEGQLVARSVLRLLGNENGEPQLFLESVYSVNTHPKIKEAMHAFARQKAQAMGVEIYTKHEGLGLESSGGPSTTLISRGSRAPYVYVDAIGGKARNGIYEIPNTVSLGQI